MHTKNMDLAKAYYISMGQRNLDEMAPFLHPEVKFVAPLATAEAKETVLAATKSFSKFFKSLIIRSICGSDTQAIVIYDLEFPEPIGKLSSAAALTIKNNLITNIELFYDARRFAAN